MLIINLLNVNTLNLEHKFEFDELEAFVLRLALIKLPQALADRFTTYLIPIRT